MIRSWRMEWAGHVASIEKKRKAYRILIGKPEGKRTPLEDLAVDRMTMLKWILTFWHRSFTFNSNKSPT